MHISYGTWNSAIPVGRELIVCFKKSDPAKVRYANKTNRQQQNIHIVRYTEFSNSCWQRAEGLF